jgi:hypothetical protein
VNWKPIAYFSALKAGAAAVFFCEIGNSQMQSTSSSIQAHYTPATLLPEASPTPHYSSSCTTYHSPTYPRTRQRSVVQAMPMMC